MSPEIIRKIQEIDNSMVGEDVCLIPPTFDPKTHHKEIAHNKYYRALIGLRYIIKLLCDSYMGDIVGAYNVDLFMFTNSISSPMGPGSDSEAINIKFGKYSTHLVDSSQFGFEPLLLNGLEAVYCYLPSMRGENADKRHLNQFYHCEIEICGTLENIVQIGEEYVRYLSGGLLIAKNHLKVLCKDYEKTVSILTKLSSTKKFRRVSFEVACDLLERNNLSQFINYTKHGRDISSNGELELMKILKTNIPIWLTHFDRDRVPFYQKPDPDNPTKTLNADLLFPPILKDSFGGEILGCGQRQDLPQEIIESIDRQKVNQKPYNWYIDLRKDPAYRISSGFGLGIERYITWALGLDDIKLVIPYPRIKNIISTP